jgi:hypothetical protein
MYIGVRRGGQRWIIGVRIGGERCASGWVETHRGAAHRRPHVDTWGSNRTVVSERCGAAGRLKGLTPRAALSISVAAKHVEEGDAPWCFAFLDVAKLHDMLNAAWGVSPRRAAPQHHQPLSQQCGSSPMCQHGVGALHNLAAPLPTPMHHAYRLSPPRSTTKIASPHPLAYSKRCDES